MNFEDFKENFTGDVKDTLERRNGIEYEVDARTVEKMNSSYEALTVKPEGSVIGVNLNLTDIYKELENGADYGVLVSKSADLAAEAIENRPDFDIASITDYDKMKNTLAIEVVSAERNKAKKAKYIAVIIVLLLVLLAIAGSFLWVITQNGKNDAKHRTQEIPDYDGRPYVVLNENKPEFDTSTGLNGAFENYSDLDLLGRCGPAFANLCFETMPTEERKSIGQVKPSGWKQAKYPGVINSEPPYLFNRCHLIGFQLSGENDNEKNLITGTRYFNVEGMLPFENRVREYIDETGNHVLYRVTPLFINNELVARGVTIEAWSVEDKGKSICFNVFVYNIQPGVEIDYSDGSSKLID